MRTSNIKQNERNPIIDITRGIGIILMVMFHSYAPFSKYYSFFFLSIFFVISGYVFNSDKIDKLQSLKEFVIKKVKILYIPFFFCNLIFIIPAQFKIYSQEVVCNFNFQNFAMRIMRLFLFNGGSQLGGSTWFLRTSFEAIIIYALITLLINKIKFFKLKYCVRMAFCLCSFALGYLLSKYNININNIGSAFSVIILIEIGQLLKSVKLNLHIKYLFPISLCMLITCYKLDTNSFIIITNQNLNLFWIVTSGLFGFLFTYYIAEIINFSTKLSKIISYIGQHTRIILCMHLLAFKIVTLLEIFILHLNISKLSSFPTLITTNGLYILYSAAGVFIPLIVSYILKQNLKKYVFKNTT